MITGGAYYPATMQNHNAAHPAEPPRFYKPDLPDSQESLLSAASSTFSAPALPSSSSNLSASTVAETEATSPASPNVLSSQTKPLQRTIPPSPNRIRGRDAQPNTPRIDTATANTPRTVDTAASPMSLDSPVTQGFKRTSDGSVKGATQRVDSSAGSGAHTASHKRTKSTDSHSSRRIGELSAQLKTRLSYAMVKVQNGWEKQSLEELEERTSQHGSPISAPARSDASRPTFESPSIMGRQRRSSGVSENSDQIMRSPNQSTPSDPSHSLGATPPAPWRPGTKPTLSAAVNLITVTNPAARQALDPAPTIEPRRKRRSSASHAPPPLLGSSQRKHYSDLSGLPRTPATPRAGILRMPSQQAEKDAVDTLLFMSSPNNSGRVPHAGQAQPSPLRSEAPRRVMFEHHPTMEKAISSHQPMPPPPTQHAAYYRADSAR